ncbi:MAG: YqjF family protein [Ilumatobacteraceae bacterium]
MSAGSTRSVSPDCPSPVRRAVMVQTWADLAYLHFEYDVADVQRLLPEGLDVDVFGGSAWVGLIPFSMRGVGLPHLPAVPYLGSFPEINVRTYVTRGGVPGVWFFSLDVNRLLPAVVARASYRLPYCWGRAEHRLVGSRLSTSVARRWPAPPPSGPSAMRTSPHTRIELEVGDPLGTPDEFDVWASARWGLYSRGIGQRLMYAPVEHPRWALHCATLVDLDDSLVQTAGLPAPRGAPRCLFSPGVPVRIGRPVRVSW